ncbi:MAG: M20/M25/M40 family metallo-hydrolase [Bacilli bacterium]|nr:M20/M25/M40 family metallo-hydrolase [Bacilli bacterium]
MILYIIGGLLGIVVILFLIAFVRTCVLQKKTAEYNASNDVTRINDYAKKLSLMIQKETISIRGEDQADKFREFHNTIESLFPNVFKHCEKIDIDGNLIVKWKGKNSSLDPIMLISHQDVVEATGEWTYPPFSGTIVDGKIYGRGSCDVKCGIMTFYQAVEELIQEGYEPMCDVYLGSSCTEEIGGDGAPKIVNWLKEHNIHLFMLSDEGGCIVEDPIGGVKGAFAAIGIFEKGYGDLKLVAKSKGGHSSTPPKNSPIARLAAFIHHIEKKKVFKQKFSKAVDQMFDNIALYSQNFWLKLALHNMWLFKPIIKPIIGSISAEAAAMLQTTICFTMQQGSSGANVIPQEAWVIANLRYISHQGLVESNNIISEIAKKYDIETSVITANDCSKSLDLQGIPYQMTIDCITKVFPHAGIMPYIVTGGTDSRFFDSVCNNCVRFSPMMVNKEQMKGMHGLDENITASVLPGAVDYYKEIIKIQETRKK